MATYEPTTGSIVHIELYSEDAPAAETFYERAFGWTIEPVEDVEGTEYTMWRAPNPPNGGLLARDEDVMAVPPTLFYIDVDDLADTQAAITGAGGELLVEETAVPGMGVFAIFRDPGGVVEAVWEERYEGGEPEAGWPEFTDEPDAGSVVHFELYSEDPAATRRFHEAVFGWEFETVGDGEYTIAKPPTPPHGGLLEAGEAMPVGTLAYLLVDSAEDTTRTIEDAGGRVVRDPFEIEGWGTMAVFEAPGGILQAIWEPAPEMADQPAAEAPETIEH